MDNRKTPSYYIVKMIKDLEFVVFYTKDISLKEFCEDEVLNSAISFKFVQISENAKKIPNWIISKYDDIPWNKIRGVKK